MRFTYSQVTVCGRLTSDPELRALPSGNFACRFTLAVDRRHKGDRDAPRETDFIPVTLWNGEGERAAKFLKKGQRAMVVGGEIRIDTYEKDGEKRRLFGVSGGVLVPIDWQKPEMGAPVEDALLEDDPPF